MNIRIFRQQDVLASARAELEAAREAYVSRLVSMYKGDNLSPITLLLGSKDLADFYARALMITRIAENDRRAYQDAALAAAESEYQAAHLDDLKAQEVALRQISSSRAQELQRALDEQQAIVAKLSEESRQLLFTTREANKLTRKQWRDSSIPLDQPIEMASAVVEPYTDRVYTVPAYQPRRYRSTGETFLAVCSWYGNEFHGRPSASGQIFNQDDLTCASKTLPFGTRLALTRGDKRIIVVVTDRGPFIAGRDLDLSREAARRLGFSGVQQVHAEYVEVAQ